MNTSLVILVPVLRRPQNVQPLLDSIAAATPEPHRVLFICDPGDRAEQDAIAMAGGEMISPGGNYAQKINAGIRATTESLIFTGADDLHFHPGWLQAALAKMTPSTGIVGTNDLCNKRVIAGRHSTHSLAARWYAELGTIDQPGQLLHEGYEHEFVDDELIETAKYRGAYAHAPDAIVEHLHPDVGKAPLDELYAAQRDRMRRTRTLFTGRRPLWTRPFDVTVLVGTYGDTKWTDLARSRAIPSAEAQGVPVIHVHGATLAQARNTAAERARSEWLVFLDADDELAAGYINAMANAGGDLRGPAVQYVRNRQRHPPKVWPPCDMHDGNYLVIGTAVRRTMFQAVGGFGEEALYEDWALWVRCWKAGATIEVVPDAVYIAHAHRNSRNRSPSQAEKLHWHHHIRRAEFPERYAAAA